MIYGNLSDSFNDFQSLDVFSKYNMMLESLSDYYCGNVPLDVSERFSKDSFLKYDMVIENLQSHDFKKLIEALITHTPYIFDELPDVTNYKNAIYKSENGLNTFLLKLKDGKLIENQDVIDILNFFNFYPSQILRDGKSVIICPVFPELRTDFIMNECHGVVYHISKKENTESILKNGLRCRDDSARNYPKRIYVFATNDFSKVGDITNELLKSLGVDKEQVDLLKIKLPSHGDIPFYDDDAMPDKRMFFTYTHIPGKFIEKIKVIG